MHKRGWFFVLFVILIATFGCKSTGEAVSKSKLSLNGIPYASTPVLISVDGSNTINSDLNCSAIITDPDGDKMNVTVYGYNNGVLRKLGEFRNNYPSNSFFSVKLGKGNLTAGDVWICTMRLFDGKSYSQWYNSSSLAIRNPNNPPNTPIVTLRSVDGSNTTNSDLECSATVSDPDRDNLTVTVAGYKNRGTAPFRTINLNRIITSGSTFSVVLSKSYLHQDEIWSCGVRSYDGKSYSRWGNSNEILIKEPIYSGGGLVGSGTIQDPYRLSNCLQLQNMSVRRSSYFILSTNIDCSATRNWNSGKGFQPIYFTGTLDGKGFSISNLYIRDMVPEPCPYDDLRYGGGLFCRTDGTIKNLNLVNFDIESYRGTSSDTYGVGALSGDQFGGLIDNVSVNGGTVKGNVWVGGVVGIAAGTIQNVKVSNVNVIATDANKGYAGGIAGSMGVLSGLRYLTNSYAVGGSLSGTKSNGGLVGRDRAEGPVNGYGSATIVNSYWSNNAAVCINPYDAETQIAQGSSCSRR